MHLLSATVAFRGDSLREVLWSDLLCTNIPMNDISLGAEVKVISPTWSSSLSLQTLPLFQALVILADNAKHNQEGRIDEHGAFRHRLVELCPIGALAALFFGVFHITKVPLPDFKPDFSYPGFGEYGRREWYEYYAFPTKNMTKAMSYDSMSIHVCIFCSMPNHIL